MNLAPNSSIVKAKSSIRLRDPNLRLVNGHEFILAGDPTCRGTTINRLIDEMTTLMLAEFDAETRFRLRAQAGAGKAERGLDLLNKALG